MGEYIQITSKDGGTFKAYIAAPEKTPAPVVIVIQEIFGINNVMREKCEWLASEGFVAVCPDLFWRTEPDIELHDDVEEELQRAFSLFGEFDIDAGIKDLSSTAETMRDHALGNGKVGCMGYCLGGKLAYMMASRTDIDASVGYYGVGLDALLGEADNIKNGLVLHIAGNDQFVPEEAQKKVMAAFEGRPNVTTYHYPGLDHAFTRGGSKHFDPDGAKLADGRTIEFLHSTLGLAKAA